MFVLLDSIQKVNEFVNTVSRFDEDIDLMSGRYYVDAKSLMGIFSLDLSKPIQVIVHDREQVGKVEESLLCFAK